MQESIQQMSKQLTEKWEMVPKNRKIQIAVGLAASILAIVLATVMLSRPTMVLLYTQNLETKQVAEVVEVLTANNISHEIVHNGLNVEVLDSQLNAAKIALATEDVPKGDYSFSDAINNSMSTTESEREAKMEELLEVDIERMLMSMDDIIEADVTLVIPEQRNSFIAANSQSSASVLLELDKPQNSGEIEGIARLIKSSVDNLELENISIVDTEGNVLYTGEDVGMMTTSDQQELKLTAEKTMEAKIIELLSPIYDEVRISPNLILDFDQYEEMKEEYIPQESGKGLPEREVVQSSSGTNTPVEGGEPGIANNGGGGTVYQVGNGATFSESETVQEEIDYVNDKIISTLVRNVGTVDYGKSSIAVNVFQDKIYRQEMVEATLNDNETWEMFKETNRVNVPIEVNEGIIELVKSGTGIENVVVQGYEKPVFIDAEPFELDVNAYLPFALILLIIIVGVMAMLRFRRHDDIIETEPELEIEEMLNVARHDIQEEDLDDIELREALETKNKIEKFVDEKPEAVANLLRNWLSEDEWG